MPDTTSEQPTGPSTRKRLLVAVRVIVSVVLLAVLFSRIDAGELWASAKQVSVPWLIFALALYFVHVLASTWHWRVLLDA